MHSFMANCAMGLREKSHSFQKSGHEIMIAENDNSELRGSEFMKKINIKSFTSVYMY